jgi:RNA polymerase subunit RPABC4/transcription elongation factor Spt4
MAQKEKACLNCKTIYFGDKCPSCDATPATETFKGRLHVFNAEKSELANRLKIKKEGEFAIKLK